MQILADQTIRALRAIRGIRNRTIAAFSITAFVFAIWCSSAMAQSGAGVIQGTVADSTGALVPGASIHVVNSATGVATNATSNGVGFYQVPGLFTGPYTVTVTALGMKTYKTSLELLVAQTAVVNPRLTPGAVSQEIVVNANSVQLITPDNGSLTSTLEDSRIQQLPENGRDLTNLVTLTTPDLLDNGQPEEFEYVVDGVATRNDQNGGIATPRTQIPDPDSVQEVRVEFNGSGAQYATPVTAVVSTKSGTNKLHGTFFETSRNNAIGVARNRNNPADYIFPKYDRNEFGASIGGPIMIPHIYNGKDKSFFFFAYERYSLVNDATGTAAVPTEAMRSGDFSGLIDTKGVLQTLYDPSTTAASAACAASPTAKGVAQANPYCRTPFAVPANGLPNQIPVGEESPFAKIYYQLVPLPFGPYATADPLVTNNLNYITKQYQIVPQETFRLDHVFNENNRAYLRFSDIDSPINTDPNGPYSNAVGDIPAGALDGYAANPSQSFLAALGYTHIFSPTFFAETIVSQQWLNNTDINGFDPNVDYETQLGLPNNFGEVGTPGIGVSTLLLNLQSSQASNNHNTQTIFDIDENLTKTVGRHQLHFGGRFRQQRDGAVPAGNPDQIMFSTGPTAVYQPTSAALYTAVTNTGDNDASFFLGSAESYKVNLQPPYVHYRTMELDAYLQDDFHVSDRLTFNLGLRYEAHPALWTKDGLNNTFDFKNDAQVFTVPVEQLVAKGYTTQAIITNDEFNGVKFETAQEAGLPSQLMYNYNLNFLPRVGFAWLPFGSAKTVIRGAFGSYDYPTSIKDYANHPEQNNPFEATYTQSYSSAAQAVDGLGPNELLRYNDPQKFGIMGSNTANVVNTSSTNSILPGYAIFSTTPNWAPAEITQANVTIEQPLKGNAALRVSWIFTHGSHLITSDNYNNSPSNYQWEMAYGISPPTGTTAVIGTPLQNTYAATAMGPYNQTTWGNNTYQTKSGFANINGLQINYQRLYRHGLAFQITGNYFKQMAIPDTATIDPAADYPGVEGSAGVMTSLPGAPAPTPGLAPPPRPAGLPDWADYPEMDRYQQYQLTSAPLHFKGNGIYDLPLGRGKRFLGHVNRFWNEIVGGYQIAATGDIASQLVAPPAADFGSQSPIHIYKHKYPVQDCRSGVCVRGYLWYNSYLPPTVLPPANGGICTSDCVTGLPATYVPFQTPIENVPPPGNVAKDCTGASCYYGDNDVNVTLLNGTTNTIAYDNGPQGANPQGKTELEGPINWTIDASIFKVFPITERVRLRFNVDAFNALNMQGNTNPGAAGLEEFQNSFNTPRQIQLTARLTF